MIVEFVLIVQHPFLRPTHLIHFNGERYPRAEFKITYDGEALQNHTMDVRDLAPSP